MLRMQTIAECARLIRESDPGTAITQNAIRTKVLTGEIPHVQVGRKRLQAAAQQEYGTIRRVM